MANLRDIRRRIASVKNTAQITKAMQLVAASKMKKAQDQAISSRAYASLMNRVLVNLKEHCDEESHPLLQEGRGEKELLVWISTDKGLCGGLNTNLFKKINEKISRPDQIEYITVGSKGRKALARLGRNLKADFPIVDPAPFADSRRVSHFIMEQFRSGEFKSVKVAFTNFVNTMKQEPLVETLLPIQSIDLGRDKNFIGMGEEKKDEVSVSISNYGGYIFEPSAETVLNMIVPQYVDYQFFQMVLESRASEHSARMVAMKTATDNAKQMVKDLTLDYNKARQAAITSELLEITTAMKALE